MSIASVSGPASAAAYEVKVQKIAQDQAKVEGEQAVALIEGSSAKPVGPDGQGSRIDTYA